MATIRLDQFIDCVGVAGYERFKTEFKALSPEIDRCLKAGIGVRLVVKGPHERVDVTWRIKAGNPVTRILVIEVKPP